MTQHSTRLSREAPISRANGKLELGKHGSFREWSAKSDYNDRRGRGLALLGSRDALTSCPMSIYLRYDVGAWAA